LGQASPTFAIDWDSRRAEMLNAVRAMTRDTADYIGKPFIDARVLMALDKVPRHRFVPMHLKLFAYHNRPLPIGHGQTISQPYIVALMTDLLDPQPQHVVLEVGTGSGYQAAVMSELVRQVYTMEIIADLAEEARERLNTLGYDNIKVRAGDGYYGWPDKAPFDSIIVTAAGNQIPPPLIKQLKVGGRMILPVGDLFSVQHLVLIEKRSEGEIQSRQILPVQFVPLTGKH
jgi:protein-L-isoaspartate(D-aspartate) O-methyltransferase